MDYFAVVVVSLHIFHIKKKNSVIHTCTFLKSKSTKKFNFSYHGTIFVIGISRMSSAPHALSLGIS
jgi:hypothetical protein